MSPAMEPQRHVSSLTGLPSHVRQRILSFAGLVRGCPVSLVLPGSRQHHHHPQAHPCRYQLRFQPTYTFARSASHPECSCEVFPKQILLVSRAISQDAVRVLYRQNAFIVRAQTPQDLLVLRSLPQLAIASITRLMVRLSPWPCSKGHNVQLAFTGMPRCAVCDRPANPTPPLDRKQGHGEAMLEQWRQTCDYLASYMTPGQVDFAFTCDVVEQEFAEEMLASMSTLPRLSKCSIKFDRASNDYLQALARKTSIVLTHAEPSYLRASTPFRYLDLPTEVRLHILKYTHLASQGDYGWHSKQRFGGTSQDWRIRRIHIKGNKRVPAFPVSVGISCCWECSFADCCCLSAKRAAYSASCVCRFLPNGLLALSRQMRHDCLQVLFSQNRFVFEQEPGLTLEFFQRYLETRSNILASFRHIQLILDDKVISEFGRFSNDWKLLMLLISQYCNPSRLFLEIYTHDHDWCVYRCTDFRKLYGTYTEIGRSLLPFYRGSRPLDLHVHFGWFRDLERVIERWVMGDSYSAVKGVKFAKDVGDETHREFQDLPEWHTDDVLGP